MALPRAISEQYRAQQRLIVATLGLTRLEWSKMGSDFDASWANIAPRVELLTASAQLGAARNGASYVPRVLAEYGESIDALANVDPRAFAGVASDGRPLGSLLEGAKIHAKRMNSLEAGGKWLDMAVHTQVADASRGAAAVSIATRPGVGWVRMVNPPCCGPCAVLAGREYRFSQGFRRHPRCDCMHIPTTLANPGDHYGIDPHLDQITDLTEAERKALQEGSDLSRVINARRGSKGMTTTELAGRGRTRLTPDGIFARAGGNRDEALRLLRQNGYITDSPRIVRTARIPTAAPKVAARQGVDLSRMRAAKTTSEIGDELQRIIGNRGVVSGFDGAALDIAKVRTVAEQTAKLFDRYPLVNANVRIMPIKNSRVYAQASAQRDGYAGDLKDLELQVSASKMGKRSKIAESFQKDVHEGHFHATGDTDPMEYLVSHEFGHLVDFAARGGVNAHVATRLRLVEDIKKELLQRSGIVNMHGVEQFRWTKENVSGYGRTNGDELIAEAFADVVMNGERAKEFSRRIHDAYVELLKARRG